MVGGWARDRESGRSCNLEQTKYDRRLSSTTFFGQRERVRSYVKSNSRVSADGQSAVDDMRHTCYWCVGCVRVRLPELSGLSGRFGTNDLPS